MVLEFLLFPYHFIYAFICKGLREGNVKLSDLSSFTFYFIVPSIFFPYFFMLHVKRGGTKTVVLDPNTL